VDLNKAIESTVTVARNEWKYIADLTTDLAADLPLVPCLLGQFNQVILNMIVNATHAIADVVKGTSAKGTITITTRRVEGWAEVRITDSGTGIPEDIRRKIFDPFFTTKEVGKGTGQGLAIAHSVVVDKHQGTIAIESEMGRGTTFIVRLPLELQVMTDVVEMAA
jgi:signal transduction histidine kinase